MILQWLTPHWRVCLYYTISSVWFAELKYIFILRSRWSCPLRCHTTSRNQTLGKYQCVTRCQDFIPLGIQCNNRVVGSNSDTEHMDIVTAFSIWVLLKFEKVIRMLYHDAVPVVFSRRMIKSHAIIQISFVPAFVLPYLLNMKMWKECKIGRWRGNSDAGAKALPHPLITFSIRNVTEAWRIHRYDKIPII